MWCTIANDFGESQSKETKQFAYIQDVGYKRIAVLFYLRRRLPRFSAQRIHLLPMKSRKPVQDASIGIGINPL